MTVLFRSTAGRIPRTTLFSRGVQRLLVLLFSLALLSPNSVASASPIPKGVSDYSFLWWAHGWRERSPEGKKLLNIQTNRYGLGLDVEKAEILHLGEISVASDYRSAATDDNSRVFSLPPATLRLGVATDKGGYRCVRVNPKALPSFEPSAGIHPDTGYVTDGHPSRLIASGRFVQRVDLMYLEFEDKEGGLLPALGRLEVIAWPDRLDLILEVTPNEPLNDVQLEIELSQNENTLRRTAKFDSLRPGTPAQVHLAWSPDADRESGGADDPPPIRVQATDLNGAASALEVIAEATGGWFRIPMRSQGRADPKDWDHLDRYALSLSNLTDRPRVARLFFQFEGGDIPPITGFTPILLDRSGEPSGIPVQISKNWHRQEGKTFLYEGPWFHGFTTIPLAPGEVWQGTLVIASAHWGGLPAASHAQLSLIGWGVNQLWDQVAIGSWGESICYDPDVNLNRSMIDDVRPLMVWGMTDGDEKKKWGWTHNVGGGDFLVYFDAAGQKQFLTRMKTAYLSHGPNLTEAIYSGVTADGKMSATFTVSSPRGDDLNRAFHRIRYDVHEPTPFSRLAFYQVGADGYNDHDFEKLARGNRNGLIEEWTFPKGGKRYDSRSIPCEGEGPWWFSLHVGARADFPHVRRGGAWANRGLIVRAWKARLGGKEVSAPSASFFGTENGVPSMNLEISPPPDLKRLEPGDFVEAELELVIPPQSASDYYGPNEAFRAALEHGGNTWKPVHREAAGNRIAVRVDEGTLLSSYPIRIRVGEKSGAAFKSVGGVGYVPIVFEGLSRPDGFDLFRIEEGAPVPIDQSVHGNDFWQTDFDPRTGTWSRTYNIPMDSTDDQRVERTFQFRMRD